MSVLKKFYGNAIVLAAAYERRGIAYRSRERINSERDRRFRGLIRYAADHVPYYQHWFSENRINPEDLRSPDDLIELPLLEKAEVRRNPEQFRATTRLGKQAIRFTTSGTTGSPLTVYHDRHSILENMAFGEPSSAVRAEKLGRRFGYRVIRINRAASTARKVRGFFDTNSMVPFRPRTYVLDVAAPPGSVVGSIRRLKPDVLGGYGSYLEMLFRYLYERRVSIPLPKLVCFAAEGMSSAGRRLISGHFGIPVLGNYAAVECFKIGFQCGHGDSYHLHDDLCHVRIAGEKGETVPNGSAGSVVISNLVNRGTVLLNYRLGDIGSLADQACECGRTLRLLSGLEGRTEDMLTLPDGGFLHPRAIWALLNKAEGILRYQLLQYDHERFELKLVATSDSAYDQIIRQTGPELQKALGESASINFSRHSEIPPEPSGKFRPVISKLRGSDSA